MGTAGRNRLFHNSVVDFFFFRFLCIDCVTNCQTSCGQRAAHAKPIRLAKLPIGMFLFWDLFFIQFIYV